MGLPINFKNCFGKPPLRILCPTPAAKTKAIFILSLSIKKETPPHRAKSPNQRILERRTTPFDTAFYLSILFNIYIGLFSIFLTFVFLFTPHTHSQAKTLSASHRTDSYANLCYRQELYSHRKAL